MDGWVMIHRQIAHNAIWTLEPFTRGQAWVDLILLAQYKPGSIMVRGIAVPLERGQCGYSELTLSERWKWSRGKVRRFISFLKKEQMVDVKQDNKTTIVTVLNYDKYQTFKTADGTADSTASGTADGHQTDTNNKDNNENNIIIPEHLSEYADFARNFQHHVKGINGAKAPTITDVLIKKCAEEVDKLIRIDGHPFEQIKTTMRWAVKDEFWASNAMSLAALRKKGDDGRTKFQKILAAKDRSVPTPHTPGAMLTAEQIKAMCAVN